MLRVRPADASAAEQGAAAGDGEHRGDHRPAKLGQVHSGQSSRRPSSRGSRSAVREAVARPSSSRSSRAVVAFRRSGRSRGARTRAAIPTGTFTQKMARQPESAMSRWIRTPPISCPVAAARPITVGVDPDRARHPRAGVHISDQGQHHRRDHRAGDALGEPCADERLDRRRGPARGGGGDEQGDAHREHPPAAPPVAEPGDRDEQGAEGEAVPGDDPLEAAAGGMEVALHRGQRDVDDEEVEDHQERPAHEDGEGCPAAVSAGVWFGMVVVVSECSWPRRSGLPSGEGQGRPCGLTLPPRESVGWRP